MIAARVDALVIGAGFGGLAVAAMLRRRGVPALVLEAADAPGGAWRRRYDALRLNTARRRSHAPGLRFPRAAGRWPGRDDVVAHLAQLVERTAPEIALRTEAHRIDRDGEVWRVETSRGPFSARAVVVATGQHRDPVLPEWPGSHEFRGPLLHSAAYRNAEPFRDRHVLVAGGGESSGDLCLDLVAGGAARVMLSVRRTPAIYRIVTAGITIDRSSAAVARLPLGAVDFLAWASRRLTPDLSAFGLPRPPRGSYAGLIRRRRSALLERGGLVHAIREGRIEVVPGIERLEREGAVLSDDRRVRADAIVAATGYRARLEPLVGHLGVLEQDGYPLVHGAEQHPAAPGLFFVGFRYALGGTMRDMRRQSKRVARAVARRA